MYDSTVIDIRRDHNANSSEVNYLKREASGPKRSSRWAVKTSHLLLGILMIQAGLSLRLIWANSAFNDEALYLWSGHLEIAHLAHGAQIPEFQTYFSGAPVLYPVLGAVADSYGGLVGARLLSLVFMLGATCLVYATAGRLFDRKAGLIAAALFAFLGPAQYLGAFATYDAMTLFLVALAAYLTVLAKGRLAEILLILAALTLTVANATKYSSALWDPVVILLAALTETKDRWAFRILRAVRFAEYIGVMILVALTRYGQYGYIKGILFTTLSRQAGTVPAGAVLRDSAYWVGIVVLIALRSLIIAENPRMRALCITLTAAVLLAPLEQARIHTQTSLNKHVAFGAWFGAIAAGYVLARAVDKSKYSKWRIAAATAVLVAVIGTLQASTFYAAWPNSKAIIAATEPLEHRHAGITLAEQGAVVDYYLKMSPASLIDTFGFTYKPDPRAKKIVGTAAYVEAIHRHYFAVVELDFSFTARKTRDGQILSAIEHTPGYRLVTKIPWRSNQGRNVFMLWQYS